MPVHASEEIELAFTDSFYSDAQPRVGSPPGPSALSASPMSNGEAWGVMVISDDEDVTEEFNQLACIANRSDDELAQAPDESMNNEFELLFAIAQRD